MHLHHNMSLCSGFTARSLVPDKGTDLAQHTRDAHAESALAPPAAASHALHDYWSGGHAHTDTSNALKGPVRSRVIPADETALPAFNAHRLLRIVPAEPQMGTKALRMLDTANLKCEFTNHDVELIEPHKAGRMEQTQWMLWKVPGSGKFSNLFRVVCADKKCGHPRLLDNYCSSGRVGVNMEGPGQDGGQNHHWDVCHVADGKYTFRERAHYMCWQPDGSVVARTDEEVNLEPENLWFIKSV